MNIKFYKYQGAGNDFVMIDDRSKSFPVNTELIEKLCDRHFGIGGDGLILLQEDEKTDFRMVYYNSDGREGSMCGNGGRCVIRFAHDLGLISDETRFMAVDGLHEGIVKKDNIWLKMSDVKKVEIFPNHLFLDTGSPHHIEFVEDEKKVDVRKKGAEIRYGSPYFENGSNVNFIRINKDNTLNIRTYERGVEDETLACGTGITAAAIAAYESGKIVSNEVKVSALGGNLEVRFEKDADGVYKNIWLIGSAKKSFEGIVETTEL